MGYSNILFVFTIITSILTTIWLFILTDRGRLIWDNILLKLPDKTKVYPAHDYNGNFFSTIEKERKNNPRLQVKSADEYADIMNNLNLPNPKLMDIAIPRNLKLGEK